MSSINKAVQLYEMMAERFAKTGWTPEQSAIYAKIATFMKNECATVEEAAEKLKNSPLYLAPSVALMKDKINAFIRAAEDDEIEGVAEAYRQKLTEIDKDPQAMYDPAFFTTAHNLHTKHFMRLASFGGIYFSYLDWEAGIEVESAFLTAFDDLERYGGDFAKCAQRPEFREIIPINDAAYELFVKDAMHYRSNLPNFNKERDEIGRRYDAFSSHFDRTKIEECQSAHQWLYSACVMTAPTNESGDYEFSEVIKHYFIG